MSTLFPSTPPYKPASPEGDGFAHVTITKDGIDLQLSDHVVHIPGQTISKGSVIIKPGGDDAEINTVELVLLASDVWLDDDIRGEVKVRP